MSLFKKEPPSILIIDDEPDIAEVLAARLDLEGYKTRMANNGKEGIESARGKKPDLIILDVMMPVLNGYEACKILKNDEKTKTIPILILTALPHVGDADKAFEVGANDYLNKPYKNDRLIEKVKKLLNDGR